MRDGGSPDFKNACHHKGKKTNKGGTLLINITVSRSSLFELMKLAENKRGELVIFWEG